MSLKTSIKLAKLGAFCAIAVNAATPCFAMFSDSIQPPRSYSDSLKTNAESAKPKKYSLKVGGFAESYVTPTMQGRVENYQVIEAEGSFHTDGETIQAAGQAKVGGAVNSFKNYQYYVLPELYGVTTSKFSETSRIVLGRKIMPWSELDRQWQLGLWQPRFRWNYFEPSEQGLTGLFLEHNEGNFGAMIFASPVFLPEQGPGYSLSDGAFTSGSRYFGAPDSNVQLFSQQTRIRYSIDMPAISKIIVHPSAAASFKYQSNGGWRTQVSYAFKPMNQILMGADGFLDLNSFDARVTAHPRVVYHHLISLEGGYVQPQGIFSAWSGLTREVSTSDETPETWTIQQTSNATVMGAGIDANVFRINTRPTRVGIAALKRSGGDAFDRGPFANPTTSLFESRYAYKDALSANLSTPFFGTLGSRFTLSEKVTYELNNQSYVSLTRLSFEISKNFSAIAGAELLASPVSTPTVGFNSDMISRNRSNDRVFGGVNYVF